MVLYRRNYVPGATYFFTVTLADRRSTILVDHVDALRAAYAKTHARFPFETVAICILPDHLHAIWTLPENDADYSRRWTLIKSTFARTMRARDPNIAVNARGEINVWQRRFWEHTIRDDRDLSNHIDYVHGNPVKHGYVEDARDWPHSSIYRMSHN